MKVWAVLIVAVAALGITASALSAPVRPDDRDGVRGVGAAAQVDESDALSRYIANNAAAVRPDDAPGVRGPGSIPAVPGGETAPADTGIGWYDIGIGVMLGAAAMLVLLLAGYTLRRGGHLPHRPAHGH